LEYIMVQKVKSSDQKRKMKTLILLLLLSGFPANAIGSWTTDFTDATNSTSGPCGGKFNDRSGTFTSPRYPNNYPNNADCTWIIQSPENTNVLLAFNNLELESCCDFIRVYDGNSTLYPFLGTVLTNLDFFQSTRNSLTVHFYSDSSVTMKGFRANWVFKDAPSCKYICGYHLGSCSCRQNCRNYGNCCPDYDTSPSCKYNCGYHLGSCSCTQNCRSYGNCCPDYNNYCSTGMTTAGFSCKYNCGYAFSTCSCTYDCQYNGKCCPDFHWYCPAYSTEMPGTHPQCGGHLYGSGLFSSPNYPYYYPDNSYCVWYLSVQQGQRIFLTFADVQLDRCCACDYITVHDGSTTSTLEMGKVCYNETTVQTFHSSSRYMTIVFKRHVDCSSGNMVIVIQSSYLNSLGLSGDDLYVNDHRCRPNITSREVVFRFPLDTCGTTEEIMNGYVSYLNNVRASQSQSGEITRQSQFVLNVGCRMEPDTSVQIFYRASESVNANITGTGHFNASIAFYTSSSFQQQIYDSPYLVNLRQYIYVQAKLTRSDSSLDLFLDTCVASPNPDDFTDRSYDLLRNGCPKDNTFDFYTNGEHEYARFRFQAFMFLRTHSEVHLQCKVTICPDKDANSRCRQGCRNRRKRSLGNPYDTDTVMLGPIKLKDLRPEAGQMEGLELEKSNQ
ncbi:hypothetical protein DNTS_035361, partial [Danionella cerebrum]